MNHQASLLLMGLFLELGICVGLCLAWVAIDHALSAAQARPVIHGERVEWFGTSWYKKGKNWSRDAKNQVILVAWIGLLIGAWNLFFPISQWLANLAPEFVSIGITILLVDRLVEKSNEDQERRRLLARMVSKSSSVAEEAVAELCARGWLTP